ncbi:MAG: M48 family metalloprotease [Armatimonadetes bacterium]|nr:M48 family metalloprotease [Armatimonadota bacterium]
MALAAFLVVASAPAVQVPDWAVVVAQTATVDGADEKHKREIQDDIKLGQETSAQVEKELPVSENAEYVQKALKIGDELSAIANRKQVKVTWGDPRLSSYPYHFQVLKGDDVNAFSLPGGYIYIYEGVFKFAESDDEIAGVIAHEISHAAFRHIATLRREQSKFDLINIPLIIAAILSKSTEAAQIMTGGQLLNQAVFSGWSVKAEEAADYGGLQYMLSSKYNPVGMLTFMERLAFRDRGQPKFDYGIYQTHPPSAERAKALMQKLQEAHVPIKRSAVSTSMSSKVLPGENGTVELWFGKSKLYLFGGSDALTRADAASAALDGFFDSVPAIYDAVIEGTKLVGKDQMLIDVSSDDGPEAQKSLEGALATIKRLLFDLNYRLWQNPDR